MNTQKLILDTIRTSKTPVSTLEWIFENLSPINITESILYESLYRGNIDLVKFLYSKLTDNNPDVQDYLFYLLLNNKLDIIFYLFENKMTVSHANFSNIIANFKDVDKNHILIFFIEYMFTSSNIYTKLYTDLTQNEELLLWILIKNPTLVSFLDKSKCNLEISNNLIQKIIRYFPENTVDAMKEINTLFQKESKDKRISMNFDTLSLVLKSEKVGIYLWFMENTDFETKYSQEYFNLCVLNGYNKDLKYFIEKKMCEPLFTQEIFENCIINNQTATIRWVKINYNLDISVLISALSDKIYEKIIYNKSSPETVIWLLDNTSVRPNKTSVLKALETDCSLSAVILIENIA